MTLAKSMIILTPIIMLASGCSGDKIREGVYQGIYEGARIDNRGEFTPAERANRPDPEFDKYSRDQKERIEGARNNKQ
jgi:hypothetical protein